MADNAAWPSNEALRIMLAIHNGTMGLNSNGRYIIVGGDRPDRRTRERLAKRGYIENWYEQSRGTHYRLTDKGKAALASVGFEVPA